MYLDYEELKKWHNGVRKPTPIRYRLIDSDNWEISDSLGTRTMSKIWLDENVELAEKNEETGKPEEYVLIKKSVYEAIQRVFNEFSPKPLYDGPIA